MEKNFPDSNLLAYDLSKPFDIGSTPFTVFKPSNVPSISEGYLFPGADNASFYLADGWYTGWSDKGNAPKDFALWKYAVDQNQWSQVDGTPSWVKRQGGGAGAMDSSRGVGWYLGILQCRH